MKKIEAVIRPEKVGAVRKALEKVKFTGLTITQVDGHGKEKGTTQKFQGRVYKVGLLPKTKLEIIASDEQVDSILKAMVEAGRTGKIGDGKIFVYTIETAIRIRTGEKGVDAL
ncbi:MAG: P-II family nitrogen regulator [Candidatus Omnitrophota bacterium]|jgi:nitrogen regulatory protein P-II 1